MSFQARDEATRLRLLIGSGGSGSVSVNINGGGSSVGNEVIPMEALGETYKRLVHTVGSNGGALLTLS